MEWILVLDAAKIIICDKNIKIMNLVQILNFDYFLPIFSVNGYIYKKIILASNGTYFPSNPWIYCIAIHKTGGQKGACGDHIFFDI